MEYIVSCVKDFIASEQYKNITGYTYRCTVTTITDTAPSVSTENIAQLKCNATGGDFFTRLLNNSYDAIIYNIQRSIKVEGPFLENSSGVGDKCTSQSISTFKFNDTLLACNDPIKQRYCLNRCFIDHCINYLQKVMELFKEGLDDNIDSDKNASGVFEKAWKFAAEYAVYLVPAGGTLYMAYKLLKKLTCPTTIAVKHIKTDIIDVKDRKTETEILNEEDNLYESLVELNEAIADMQPIGSTTNEEDEEDEEDNLYESLVELNEAIADMQPIGSTTA
ncbi:hypothetical protein [Orientia tsutsugamushi]|nr:hypothetical protein [Orientia tsutsugamushi]